MSDIKKEAEKIVDHTINPEHETQKEAKKRQPWMPIIGTIVAALILFSLYSIFAR